METPEELEALRSEMEQLRVLVERNPRLVDATLENMELRGAAFACMLLLPRVRLQLCSPDMLKHYNDQLGEDNAGEKNLVKLYRYVQTVDAQLAALIR